MSSESIASDTALNSSDRHSLLWEFVRRSSNKSDIQDCLCINSGAVALNNENILALESIKETLSIDQKKELAFSYRFSDLSVREKSIVDKESLLYRIMEKQEKDSQDHTDILLLRNAISVEKQGLHRFKIEMLRKPDECIIAQKIELTENQRLLAEAHAKLAAVKKQNHEIDVEASNLAFNATSNLAKQKHHQTKEQLDTIHKHRLAEIRECELAQVQEDLALLKKQQSREDHSRKQEMIALEKQRDKDNHVLIKEQLDQKKIIQISSSTEAKLKLVSSFNGIIEAVIKAPSSAVAAAVEKVLKLGPGGPPLD